ncbi:metal-dependent hydrolase [Bifidobacterium margollesii]|uniref:Metal-dependent hydrolase n=1 Tax=Bifidobacterium margollesii TaxID=2020964 RepID=A0A2N5JAL6_9BIFI|nr:SprT family zinc-dependent metalloprotease [Bifidobacterium margollesii]PLS31257.1 metal-dependent hydrolase [Bifidobacterium margollesii]
MARRTISVEIIDVQGVRVKVTRKTVKNMYLRVKPPDGRVEVTAPARASYDVVARFVASRRQWIDKAQEKVAAARARQEEAGRRAAGQDADHDHTGTADAAGTHADQPVAMLDQPWSEERKREAKAILNGWLPSLLAYWAPIIGRRPTNISLRRMSTRWGSCTPATGRIRLNLELAYLPPQYLEYVLVHELTHLWEHGHGVRFQRSMDRFMPQWRRLRRELNRIP